MEQWENKLHVTYGDPSGSQVLRELDELGKERWRPYAVSTQGNRSTVWLTRQIRDSQ